MSCVRDTDSADARYPGWDAVWLCSAWFRMYASRRDRYSGMCGCMSAWSHKGVASKLVPSLPWCSLRLWSEGWRRWRRLGWLGQQHRQQHPPREVALPAVATVGVTVRVAPAVVTGGGRWRAAVAPAGGGGGRWWRRSSRRGRGRRRGRGLGGLERVKGEGPRLRHGRWVGGRVGGRECCRSGYLLCSGASPAGLVASTLLARPQLCFSYTK